MTNFLQVVSFDPLTVTSTTPGIQGPAGVAGPTGPAGPSAAVDVVSSGSAPNPTTTVLWLDTSTVPPILRYWDGALWTALTTGGGSTVTVVDNGDGTYTATGTITDNGDGTWTTAATSVVDNGDGTFTAA